MLQEGSERVDGAEATVPSLEAITCPKCGVGVASGVVHLVERIESDRQVLGVAGAQLRVSSLYDTNADDGGGEDPHFECHNRVAETRWCDHRWPVPEWVKARIAFV
jgi:hypothetical protein